MAKPVSTRKPKQQQPRPPSPLDQQLPLVSGKWLAWSLLGIFGGGVVLVWLTVCLLFWQGQWQILFQRTDAVSIIKTNSADGDRMELVPFDVTEAGQSQLAGLFLNSSTNNAYGGKTILYLPGTTADASSRTSETLRGLQQMGIPAFTFNYRGSVNRDNEKIHPSEKRATEDTEAAWRYLVDIRHLPPSSIVFYGQGLGAFLAAEAAALHPGAAGLILDDPLPSALEILRADPRSHWVPISLLTQDRFDPTKALGTVKVPKLFLLNAANGAGKAYAHAAADPKLVTFLQEKGDASIRQEAIRRFLDQLR